MTHGRRCASRLSPNNKVVGIALAAAASSRHPNCGTPPIPMKQIYLVRAERLPRVDNIAHISSAEWCHQRMYMIWHDHPCMQQIALAGKMQKSTLDNARKRFLFQQCRPNAAIQILFNLFHASLRLTRLIFIAQGSMLFLHLNQ